MHTVIAITASSLLASPLGPYNTSAAQHGTISLTWRYLPFHLSASPNALNQPLSPPHTSVTLFPFQ